MNLLPIDHPACPAPAGAQPEATGRGENAALPAAPPTDPPSRGHATATHGGVLSLRAHAGKTEDERMAMRAWRFDRPASKERSRSPRRKEPGGDVLEERRTGAATGVSSEAVEELRAHEPTAPRTDEGGGLPDSPSDEEGSGAADSELSSIDDAEGSEGELPHLAPRPPTPPRKGASTREPGGRGEGLSGPSDGVQPPHEGAAASTASTTIWPLRPRALLSGEGRGRRAARVLAYEVGTEEDGAISQSTPAEADDPLGGAKPAREATGAVPHTEARPCGTAQIEPHTEERSCVTCGTVEIEPHAEARARGAIEGVSPTEGAVPQTEARPCGTAQIEPHTEERSCVTWGTVEIEPRTEARPRGTIEGASPPATPRKRGPLEKPTPAQTALGCAWLSAHAHRGGARRPRATPPPPRPRSILRKTRGAGGPTVDIEELGEIAIPARGASERTPKPVRAVRFADPTKGAPRPAPGVRRPASGGPAGESPLTQAPVVGRNGTAVAAGEADAAKKADESGGKGDAPSASRSIAAAEDGGERGAQSASRRKAAASADVAERVDMAERVSAANDVEKATQDGGGGSAAPAASETAHWLAERARVDDLMVSDPPLIGQPPRFANEVRLDDLPADFAWQIFDVVILASHTCFYRQCCAVRGLRAATVADRRTVLEPPPGCMHFIGDEATFRRLYPYEPGWADLHPTCGYANMASHSTWEEKVASGELLAAALNAVEMMAWGQIATLEQPPSAYTYLLGPPTLKYNALDCGDSQFKDVWYWVRGPEGMVLPTPPKAAPGAGRASTAFASKVSVRRPEERMLRRSVSSPLVASHMVDAVRPHLPPTCAASEHQAEREAWLAQMRDTVRSNYTKLSANWAPVIHGADDVSARHIVLLPVTYNEGALIHVPFKGAFGFEAAPNESLKDQAVKGSSHLSPASEPFLAGYTKDKLEHAIFVIPVTTTITTFAEDAEAWGTAAREAAVRSTAPQSTWCRLAALPDGAERVWVQLALASLAQSVGRSEEVGLRVGCWRNPVHAVTHALGHAWANSEPDQASREAWRQLLRKEAERGKMMTAAFKAADSGDGRMVAWADRIKTLADVDASIVPPPQGLPSFSSAVLRMARKPERPLPASTLWLHSLPPQCLPPGFPMTLEWNEVNSRWARILASAWFTSTASTEVERFDMSEEEAECHSPGRPPALVLGPGAFKLRQHEDGVGHYCMNSVVLEVGPDGKLHPMDFAQAYNDPRNIPFIKECLGGDALTDQECMSFLAEGARFKANMPADLRLFKNCKSLDGRARAAMETYTALEADNVLTFKPLGDEDGYVDPDGPFPAFFLPGTVGSSGAQDKPGNPLVKRPVNNASAPHSSAEQPVRVRNTPHGAPDGAHVLSLNESTGGKTKGPRRRPLNKPELVATRLQAGVALVSDVRITGDSPVGYAIVDVRKRRGDDCAANPFTGEHATEALRASYAEPDKRLEEIADRWAATSVDRCKRGYDGHVFLRAMRRIAERARQGDMLFIGCDGEGEDCHRKIVAGWVNELIRLGTYHHVPHPFPDPEIKMRPRDTYAALAILKHQAGVDEAAGYEDAFVCGFLDDMAWCFLQMRTHPCEYPNSQIHVPMARVVDGVKKVRYEVGFYRSTDMGSRPSSKINCRFAEEWLDTYRSEVEHLARAWLRTRSPALQQLQKEREEALGWQQSAPFHADVYSDDYQVWAISPSLAALLAAHWSNRNVESRIMWCPVTKKAAGTVIDAIGARNVISGGFGVLLPGKRSRVLAECHLALEGKLDRERYEANNGLLVHAGDIVDFPPGQLNGLWRPLAGPGHPSDLVTLTRDARARTEEIVQIMSSRAGASFLCAIPTIPSGGVGTHPIAWTFFASDACTDAPHLPGTFSGPAIFANCEGSVFLIPLDEQWLRRSINVIEGTGNAVSAIVYGHIHPNEKIIGRGDNVNALNALLMRGKSEDMDSLGRAFQACPSWKGLSPRLILDHGAGIWNEFQDAGSRQKWGTVHAIAAALGLRLQWLDLRDFPEVRPFLQRVLAETTAGECQHPNPPVFRCHSCNAVVSAIDNATGDCPACGTTCMRLRGFGAPTDGKPLRLWGGGAAPRAAGPARAGRSAQRALRRLASASTEVLSWMRRHATASLGPFIKPLWARYPGVRIRDRGLEQLEQRRPTPRAVRYRRVDWRRTSADLTKDVSVRTSEIEGAGRGLFLTRPGQKGDVVARIANGSWRTWGEATQESRRRSLHTVADNDAFIMVAKGPTVSPSRRDACFDDDWTDPLVPPKWFIMNHAGKETANVEVAVENPHRPPVDRRIVFRLTRDSDAQRELCWPYGGACPLEWGGSLPPSPPPSPQLRPPQEMLHVAELQQEAAALEALEARIRRSSNPIGLASLQRAAATLRAAGRSHVDEEGIAGMLTPPAAGRASEGGSSRPALTPRKDAEASPHRREAEERLRSMAARLRRKEAFAAHANARIHNALMHVGASPLRAQSRCIFRAAATAAGAQGPCPAIQLSMSLARALDERGRGIYDRRRFDRLPHPVHCLAAVRTVMGQWAALLGAPHLQIRKEGAEGPGLFARLPIPKGCEARRPLNDVRGTLLATAEAAADEHSRFLLPPRLRVAGEYCSLLGPAALINAACPRCANVTFGNSRDDAQGVATIPILLRKPIRQGEQVCAHYLIDAMEDCACAICHRPLRNPRATPCPLPPAAPAEGGGAGGGGFQTRREPSAASTWRRTRKAPPDGKPLRLWGGGGTEHGRSKVSPASSDASAEAMAIQVTPSAATSMVAALVAARSSPRLLSTSAEASAAGPPPRLRSSRPSPVEGVQPAQGSRTPRPGALAPGPPSPAPPEESPAVARPPRKMPTNAKTARNMLFEQLEEALAGDSSEHAIARGDPKLLYEMLHACQEAIAEGVPKGTQSADNNGVKWAAWYCEKFGTSFTRPLSLDSEIKRCRETFMHAHLVFEVCNEMAPRAKSRESASGEVITDAKPTSALGPLYAYRRVLASSGCELPSLKMVGALLKGLVKRFKERWGPKAMVPERRKPLNQEMLQKMNNVLGGTGSLKHVPPVTRGVRVAYKYGLATGARCDEVTDALDHLRRANIELLLDGKHPVPVTPENLRAAVDGTLLRGTPNGSKCDRDNTVWGDRYEWFILDRSNPLNFAAEWIDWELDFPCPLAERSSWAAISPDGGAHPFVERTLQSRFDKALQAAIGKADAKERSFHALRVTFATALCAKKHQDGAIQCVIRWKTLDAMRTYCKMDPRQYAKIVEEGSTFDVDVAGAYSLPEMEPSDRIDSLNEAVQELRGADEPPAPRAASKRGRGVRIDEIAAEEDVAEMLRRQRVEAETTRLLTVGEEAVRVRTADKAGLVGKRLQVHNSAWVPGTGTGAWGSDATTSCHVVGECVAPMERDGLPSCHAYVVEARDDRLYYQVPASLIQQPKRHRRR